MNSDWMSLSFVYSMINVVVRFSFLVEKKNQNEKKNKSDPETSWAHNIRQDISKLQMENDDINFSGNQQTRDEKKVNVTVPKREKKIIARVTTNFEERKKKRCFNLSIDANENLGKIYSIRDLLVLLLLLCARYVVMP